MKPVSLLLVAALACAPFRSDPWWGLRAEAQVTVVNQLTDPCVVVVGTKDGQRRALGTVAPADSMTWVLPFADETVAVWVCGLPTPLEVNAPVRHRLIAKVRSDTTRGAP